MNLIQTHNNYFDYFSIFKLKPNKLHNKQTFNFKKNSQNKTNIRIYHNYYPTHNILDLNLMSSSSEKIFCYFCAINFR